MKYTLSKFGLLGLCLLLSIFVVKSVVNAANADVTIDPTYPARVWYRSVLHTLNLGDFGGVTTTLEATSGKLKFDNGLVVGNNSNVGNSQKVVIGGGDGNKILNNKNYAGIGGGGSNEVSADYAVIGGGNSNKASGNNAVVVGGNYNTAAGGSVVVGGESNNAVNGGIVLGGKNNTSYPNSLALGQGATSNEGSFAWRGTAGGDAGYINAPAGTLIGTTTPIGGVNLVVGGAVKVEGNDEDAGVFGEIRYVGNCFYGYDGNKWHVMNRGNDKNNNSECRAFPTTTAKYCEFGNTILWDGDTATAYSRTYSTSCASYRTTVTCNAGILTPAGYTHPYCYQIHAN